MPENKIQNKLGHKNEDNGQEKFYKIFLNQLKIIKHAEIVQEYKATGGIIISNLLLRLVPNTKDHSSE